MAAVKGEWLGPDGIEIGPMPPAPPPKTHPLKGWWLRAGRGEDGGRAVGRQGASFPLDRAGGLAGDVVDDPIHPFHLIDDAIGDRFQ